MYFAHGSKWCEGMGHLRSRDRAGDSETASLYTNDENGLKLSGLNRWGGIYLIADPMGRHTVAEVCLKLGLKSAQRMVGETGSTGSCMI